MMFIHTPLTVALPTLKRKNEGGKRVYYDEDGNRYESVTNVVGIVDQKGLDEWRQAVGDDVANYVSRKAMSTGTKMHGMIENYIHNIKNDEKNIFAKAHFDNIKPLLKSLTDIQGLEVRLCSKNLGLAGTADCIAKYDGIPSIVDFKSSSKQKKEEWIQKYFLQTTAYALMWEELTNTKIEQIVVLISSEDGARDTFIRNKKDYIEELHNTIAAFQMQKENKQIEGKSNSDSLKVAKRLDLLEFNDPLLDGIK